MTNFGMITPVEGVFLEGHVTRPYLKGRAPTPLPKFLGRPGQTLVGPACVVGFIRAARRM